MAEPGGKLCVLRDENLTGWMVSLCAGNANRTVLQRFHTQTEAAEWAYAECERRRATDQGEWIVRQNDDCPCRQTAGL